MTQPLFRGSKYRQSPHYGSIYGSVTKQRRSRSLSIEEGQPLILHSPDSSVGGNSGGLHRYPKATDEQRELLLLIESEMRFARHSRFSVTLPDLTERRVQKLRSKINRVNAGNSVALEINGWDGFVFCFLRSTLLFLSLTLLATVAVLVGIDKFGPGWFDPDATFDSFVWEAFPFMNAALSVLACLGPMMHRLTPVSQEVGSYSSPSSLKVAAKEGIEEMVVVVSSRVDNVNAKLTGVMDHMRHVSNRAERFQCKLRLVDPELVNQQRDVLEDPYSDAEREIQNAKEEVHTKMLTFEQDVSFDVASWVPSHLSSPRKFFQLDMIGHTLALVLIHSVGTLFVISIVENRIPEGVEIPFLSAFLSHVARIPFLEPLGRRLSPFKICWISALLLEAYLVSSLFLTNIYFVKSSCSRTVAIINDLRAVVTSHTNWLLMQNGVIFLCHDVLEVRMNQLRLKLIELVDQNHKLCSALSLADIDDGSSSGDEEDDKAITNFPFQSPTASGGAYSYISRTPKHNMTPGSVVSHQPSVDPPEDSRPSTTAVRPPADSPSSDQES